MRRFRPRFPTTGLPAASMSQPPCRPAGRSPNRESSRQADGGVLVIAMAERLPPGSRRGSPPRLDSDGRRIGLRPRDRSHLEARDRVRGAGRGLRRQRGPPADPPRKNAVILSISAASAPRSRKGRSEIDFEAAERGWTAVGVDACVVDALVARRRGLGIASLRAPLFASRVAGRFARSTADARSRGDVALAAALTLPPRDPPAGQANEDAEPPPGIGPPNQTRTTTRRTPPTTSRKAGGRGARGRRGFDPRRPAGTDQGWRVRSGQGLGAGQGGRPADLDPARSPIRDAPRLAAGRPGVS